MTCNSERNIISTRRYKCLSFSATLLKFFNEQKTVFSAQKYETMAIEKVKQHAAYRYIIERPFHANEKQ